MRRSAALLGIAATAAALGRRYRWGRSPRSRTAPASRRRTCSSTPQEWSLWPSRTSVPVGSVDVELWNRGQDIHDLRIRKLNSAGQMIGPVIGSVGHTLPGKVDKSTWRLRSAGQYELYCSLPGHLKLGMGSQADGQARSGLDARPAQCAGPASTGNRLIRTISFRI